MKLIQKKMLAVSLKGPEITIIDGTRGAFDTSEEELNKAKMNAFIGTNKEINTKSPVDIYKPLIKKMGEYNAQRVSNAWLKFYELITFVHELRPMIFNGSLKVFMNAELPGSFLCSMNHFMKKFPATEFDWAASSFIGTDGQLQDSYGLLAGNPDKWFSGDMTSDTDINALTENVLKKFPGGVNIYTSDAGIDASSNYSEQEIMNHELHLGCFNAGISVLAPGGIMITKHYTFFREGSQEILEGYLQHFERVILVKPVTSRPYNSETYIIGINFLGHTNNYTDDILEGITRDRLNMFHDIFVGRQIEFLNERISLSDIPYSEINYSCNLWIKKMKINKIEHSDHLTELVSSGHYK